MLFAVQFVAWSSRSAYAGAKVWVVTRSVSYCKVWLQSGGAACFGWASTAWTLPLSKAKVLSMWKKPCNFGASFHRLHLGHVFFGYGSLVWSFDLTNVSCVSWCLLCTSWIPINSLKASQILKPSTLLIPWLRSKSLEPSQVTQQRELLQTALQRLSRTMELCRERLTGLDRPSEVPKILESLRPLECLGCH